MNCETCRHMLEMRFAAEGAFDPNAEGYCVHPKNFQPVTLRTLQCSCGRYSFIDWKKELREEAS